MTYINLKKKLNKLMCSAFDHKWKYNFTWNPNKRTCVRCDRKEQLQFKEGIDQINDFDHYRWIHVLNHIENSVINNEYN